MVKVAILGFGVVGSGVAEVLKGNAASISSRVGEEIVVEKILDIRDFPDSPFKDKFTKDADEVFNNAEIGIVVETIGGAKIAYEFTKRAFHAGKHVITSNKELVAKCGPELLELAKKNNVSYMYEASVGGGIPIIRPIQQCLAANNISGIMGILNGTTNYILTKMWMEGKNYTEALKEAQQAGYAEQDPTADIEGIDTVRKIAILSSLAFGEYVDSDKIEREGITQVSLEDMNYAARLDCKIKLIALSQKMQEGIYARVSPVMIPKSHPLANVEDVFNGIMVRGDALGDAMFYGRGAGALPTASAVVADVIDCARNMDEFKGQTWKITEENTILDVKEHACAWFFRFRTSDKNQAEKEIENAFSGSKIITLDGLSDEIGVVTEKKTEKQLLASADKLVKDNKVDGLIAKIRFYTQ